MVVRRLSAVFPTLFAFGALGSMPAVADTVRMQCAADDAFNAPEMTLVYEGNDSGTLTVSGAFGTMSLPATLESGPTTDDPGSAVTVRGIRASGPATVRMPDKAALEACVRARLPSDQIEDADIVFVTLMACAKETPDADAPVAINASAEVVLWPMTYVGVTRTYAEATDLAGGSIALEAYPTCAIEE